MSRLSHPESHLVSRIGWLRAAVLGANDGIVSTASLIVGIAGLVAGAMSIFARTTATATRPAWRGRPHPAETQSGYRTDPDQSQQHDSPRSSGTLA